MWTVNGFKWPLLKIAPKEYPPRPFESLYYTKKPPFFPLELRSSQKFIMTLYFSRNRVYSRNRIKND